MRVPLDSAAMPNGFYGTEQEWERIEAPLRPLDGPLQAFAREHDMRLARSERNWPSRSLHWGDKVQRLIQIYLEEQAELLWNVWVCASEDRGRKRYWKNSFLRKAVPLAEIESQIGQILEEGKRIADGWQSRDLEFATNLQI
jgi:hypothetical protein